MDAFDTVVLKAIKTFVHQTPHTGKGLFARDAVRKGEPIFAFHGKPVRAPYDSHYRAGARWLGTGRNRWLATFKNNPGYYINHILQAECRH